MLACLNYYLRALNKYRLYWSDMYKIEALEGGPLYPISLKIFVKVFLKSYSILNKFPQNPGERGGSVVECRTPEREVRGSKPTAAVLCPWARHFTPRKYWLITQEAMAPSRHDWKIVDWDVKPQHNQPTPKSMSLYIPISLKFHPKFSKVSL